MNMIQLLLSVFFVLGGDDVYSAEMRKVSAILAKGESTSVRLTAQQNQDSIVSLLTDSFSDLNDPNCISKAFVAKISVIHALGDKIETVRAKHPCTAPFSDSNDDPVKQLTCDTSKLEISIESGKGKIYSAVCTAKNE